MQDQANSFLHSYRQYLRRANNNQAVVVNTDEKQGVHY